VATVTGFRAGPAGMARSVSATIRFTNKSPRRLVIGLVDGSGAATDARGTRYAVRTAGLRGIGSISSSSFDPKFGMDPGGSDEATIEFESPSGSVSDSAGTTWDIELTVREIDPVANSQYKLGKQYALRFRGLKP
jgi:hypothetical protein